MESATNELLQLNNGGVLVWFHELLWAKCPAELQQAENQNRQGPGNPQSSSVSLAAAAARQAPHLNDLPRTPHTVIFNYSHAQGWFFDPSSHRSSPNVPVRMKRKRKMHLTAAHIVEEFLTPLEFKATAVVAPSKPNGRGSASAPVHSDDRDADEGGEDGGGRGRRRALQGAIPSHHIVAQLVTRQSDYTEADAKPKVRYLNQDLLEQLLYKDTIAEGSVLQRFVPPQGPSSDPNLNHNTALLVQWQPNYCYVERFVNLYSLHDVNKTTFERGATLDSTLYSESIAVKDGASVLLQACRCCNAIAEHVRQVVGLHMRTMTCVLKVTPENHLILMWVQQAAVMEQGRIHASVLTGAADPRNRANRTVKRIGDDEEDFVQDQSGQSQIVKHKARMYQVMMQQRLIPTEAQREAAVLERASYHTTRKHRSASAAGSSSLVGTAATPSGGPSYSSKRILLPEDQADAQFDSLAPRSWLRGRDAFRFSGLPRPSSAIQSQPNSSSPATAVHEASHNNDHHGRVIARPQSAQPAANLSSSPIASPTATTTKSGDNSRLGSMNRVISLVKAHMASGSFSRPHHSNLGSQASFDAASSDDVRLDGSTGQVENDKMLGDSGREGGQAAGGTAREVISALTWSSPTRVELSLFPHAVCDGSSFSGWNQERFPQKLLAQNAGRLGLREKYLASMRQPSTTTASIRRK